MKTPKLHPWISLPSETLNHVREEAERHPTWADVQNRLGLALLTNGDPVGAAEAFSRSLARNPRYAWAAMNHAQTLGLLGEVEAARRQVETVPPPEPGVDQWVLAFLDLLEDDGASARRRLGEFPDDLRDRADVARLDAAVEGTERLGGVTWHEAGDRIARLPEDALQPVDGDGQPQWLSLIPGLHQVWLTASGQLAQLGRHRESELAAATACVLWADRGLYLSQRGFLASLRAEDDESLRLYERAARIAPENPRPHIALAYHWSAAGNLDVAYDSLSTALACAPRYADLHYQMGLLQRARRDDAGALESFRGALAINPRYAMARLEEATTLVDMERWSDAKEAYRQVLETGIQSSDICLHLGQIEEAMGNLEAAETAWREALALNPGESVAHYFLGKLYRRMGNREEAKRSWKAFLDLSRDPDRMAEVESQLDKSH